MSPNDHDNRRCALQIAAQLPVGHADAKAVLELAREIIDRLYRNDPPAKPGRVVRLVE